MCINRGMNKEDVLHIYDGILLTCKKNEMPLAAKWIELEIVILSEVAQTKTNISGYHLHMHGI